MLRAVLAALCVARGAGFQRPAPRSTGVAVSAAAAREPLEAMIQSDGDEPVPVQITPTMANSEVVVAQYPLPFFIDIENRAQLGAVVTKDGSAQQNKGAERVGDRLRAFTWYEYGVSKWTEGGGVVSMLGAFSGSGYKWNREIFDATFVSWETSLEKLVTNEPSKTDSVTMIFERPTAAE